MDELIRKKDALDAFNVDMSGISVTISGRGAGKVYGYVKTVTDRIKALPTVQPKHGKWLPDNRCGGGYWVCSSCKYPTEAFAADVLYKYCPFCGADMRGGKDGTD